MELKALINYWFSKWEKRDYAHLPVTEDFRHRSPFGTVEGKKAYLELVEKNKDKFLGYSFEIHDGIYGNESACVRYTARQGEDFELEVSEWYYKKGNRIGEIIAYYHIGDVREERKLQNPEA